MSKIGLLAVKLSHVPVIGDEGRSAIVPLVAGFRSAVAVGIDEFGFRTVRSGKGCACQHAVPLLPVIDAIIARRAEHHLARPIKFGASQPLVPAA